MRALQDSSSLSAGGPLNTPHFLTIKGVEVNAGQTASFHCTVNGRKRDNFRLWLQGIGGREAPMKATKPWNNRRFIGTFDVENTTKGDSGRYRCIVHSDKGVGVSNYGELTIKQPPVPIAPPQLTAVGATYLWIQLNANSINGDGPIIDREVEYRTVSGTMYDLQPVDKTTHKIGHLDPDTEYEISVLLTRPLEGGTGAPGPPLRARTRCAARLLGMNGPTCAGPFRAGASAGVLPLGHPAGRSLGDGCAPAPEVCLRKRLLILFRLSRWSFPVTGAGPRQSS
ncbi:unnamed protein product [Pleuronectes platessa]|uniref:Receptor-type tyrosine-protein phosphatase mu n=1 Tax=Pleuronectes platessa TaxID=8262 RepID=A0A9N7Z974_PLEPL|nr:unnamed protein product [Pleuronectes platessa]